MFVFIKSHIVSSIGLAVGGVVTVGALVNDAWNFINMGLPNQAWAAFGAAIFFISLVAIVYRQQVAINKIQNGSPLAGDVESLSALRIYSDIDELRAHQSWDKTMRAIKTMDGCFVTGHDALLANAEILKIKRLLLPDPTALSTIQYGKIRNETNISDLICSSTGNAKRQGIRVRWLNEFCNYSFFIADRDGLRPYVHIEFTLPGIPIGLRPAITVYKNTHPKIFQAFVDAYESLWDNHSKEPENVSR